MGDAQRRDKGRVVDRQLAWVADQDIQLKDVFDPVTPRVTRDR